MSIHTLYAGGSFGRRANPGSDYIVEAVSIAKAYGADGTPIKLQWTREDDIHGGLYRPMYFHKLEAGLNAQGQLTGWHHVIVGQSIVADTPFAGLIKDGIDGTSVEGAANIAYAIPNIAVDLATTKTGVPVLWWRVVGSSHTAFAVEAFIDEVAHAAGQDGFTFRRKLLDQHPRMKAVLELAAEKAGWNTPLPPGKGRGIAVAEAFKTFVAQVAEVSVDGEGQVKVDRVVCAVDCGTPINPDVIAAQMEGGIGFGLGAVLYGAITLKDGRIEQDNFNGYRVLRMNEMPKVEVHIVPRRGAADRCGRTGCRAFGTCRRQRDFRRHRQAQPCVAIVESRRGAAKRHLNLCPRNEGREADRIDSAQRPQTRAFPRKGLRLSYWTMVSRHFGAIDFVQANTKFNSHALRTGRSVSP